MILPSDKHSERNPNQSRRDPSTQQSILTYPRTGKLSSTSYITDVESAIKESISAGYFSLHLGEWSCAGHINRVESSPKLNRNRCREPPMAHPVGSQYQGHRCVYRACRHPHAVSHCLDWPDQGLRRASRHPFHASVCENRNDIPDVVSIRVNKILP